MGQKNTGLIVLVSILFLLVGGLVGFVVSDKFLADESSENSGGNNTNDKVANCDDTITENSYKTFAENMKSELSKYDDNNKNYQEVNPIFSSKGYSVYLDEKGSLFVDYANKSYVNYKIADNVLSFYIIKVGQGGGNMLYFINMDGTVGSASTEYGVYASDKKNLDIKKDIGYKNIVSIVNGSFGSDGSGVLGPIFIDINGNVFSENL